MPTFKNKNVRKLTKLGGSSLAVTIPIETIRKLKWKERHRARIA